MMPHVLTRSLDRSATVFLIVVVACGVLIPLSNLLLPAGFFLQVPTYLVALWGKYVCYAILALSQIDNVSPNLGQSYIIDSFMVVVFGGVGNLWGTLVGAFTLGIANKFLEPVAGAVLGKIAILVLIILFIQKRPRGLFALKGRAVEA